MICWRKHAAYLGKAGVLRTTLFCCSAPLNQNMSSALHKRQGYRDIDSPKRYEHVEMAIIQRVKPRIRRGGKKQSLASIRTVRNCVLFLLAVSGIGVVLWILGVKVTDTATPVAISSSTDQESNPWLLRLRGNLDKAQKNNDSNNQHVATISTKETLLSSPDLGAIAMTDVRGNLGPAGVLLQNSTTDWLKDRWQAASDMHGTAIRGSHYVQIQFGDDHRPRATDVRRIVLDWETAYADDYRIEGRKSSTRSKYDNNGKDNNLETVIVYYDSADQASDESDPTTARSTRTSHSFGQSPGVKQKLPLHVIHEITIAHGPENAVGVSDDTVDQIHIYIRKPFHPGWGVSLWRVQIYGILD